MTPREFPPELQSLCAVRVHEHVQLLFSGLVCENFPISLGNPPVQNIPLIVFDKTVYLLRIGEKPNMGNFPRLNCLFQGNLQG